MLVPTPGDQARIAELLGVADRRIAAEEQRKAALQALFQSMLQQLMTGQVRVPKGIVPRPARGAEDAVRS